MRRMTKGPRLSISLTPPQAEWLSVKSESLGITVAELVRRIVDQHREGK